MWDLTPHTLKKLGEVERGPERGRDSKSLRWVHGWLAWATVVWTNPALLFLHLLCLLVSIQSQFWHPLCGCDHCNTKSLLETRLASPHPRPAPEMLIQLPSQSLSPKSNHTCFSTPGNLLLPSEGLRSLWHCSRTELPRQWCTSPWLCLHCVFHKESLSLSSHQHL